MSHLMYGPFRPQPAHIIRAVCYEFGITPEDIRSKNKISTLVLPRHIAMFLMCKDTTRTTSKVGTILDRDHTTVIHGRDKIAICLAIDLELQCLIEKIRQTYFAEQPKTNPEIEKVNRRRHVQLLEILEVVCKEFGSDIESIQRGSEKKNVVHARHVAMYLARKDTTLRPCMVGKSLGNYSSQAVLYAYKKVRLLAQSDTEFNERIEKVRHTYFSEVP